MSGLKTRGVPGGILLAIISLLFCISSNQVAAQISPNAPSEAFNWKSGAEATTLLLNQVHALEQQLPGLTDGTSLYDNTLRRIAFFKAIVVEIDRGAAVAAALDLAIPAAATLGFSKEASYTPKITLRALHTETRIMLTN
jgi:hypothetical protein